MINHVFLFLFLISSVSGCSNNNKQTLRPAQLQDNYKNFLEKPITDRIDEIPEILLNDLSKMDSTNTYRNYKLTPEENEMIETILSKAPDHLVEALTTEVNGVYFVENFIGGGMTYFIWKNGQAKYVLIFNPKTLHETLSDWLSYRDNTTFDQNEQSYSLRENESGNNVGFLHTFIHEACHVYDFSRSVSANKDLSPTTVSQDIWQDRKNVHEKFDFPTRKKLGFYDFEHKEKVKLKEFVEDFDLFSDLPYASIYGSNNSLDEFAENETYTILKNNYGITVSLEIISNSQTIKKYIPTNNPMVVERNKDFLRKVNKMNDL